MSDPRPIAMFDSGVGGLTLVSALQRQLPSERIIYFGDSARAPYGCRTDETIVAFARQCVRLLETADPKHLLIACNTVTALALPTLRAEFPHLSISGVIEPCARAAVEAAGGAALPTVALLATEATIRSKAYERALARRRNKATMLLRPAPLLVPLIEEGRDDADPLVRLALRQYLQPLMNRNVDVLILGCTHFAAYRKLIQQIMGGGVAVIDAAQRCADDVARRLKSARRLKDGGPGSLQCYVSDDAARFRSIASRLLGLTVGDPVLVSVDSLPSDQPLPVRAAG